jgi:hypothetical protein
MLYFPQLSTGATGQFPIQKKRTARTIVNQSVQDYEIKLADPGAATTEWQISFAELNDQELAALEVLFEVTEGRLTPFTFVDPTDNLLAWSEEQNQPVWQADPLLTLTANIADPLGGTGGFQVSNAGLAMQILQQSIAAPASLAYCLSVYARSDQSTQIWLVQGSQTNAYLISPEWTRLTLAGQQSSESDSISFGVALNPGSTVDIFGMQVEAQPGASLYKQTAETGGVYPNARFRDDVMTITTVGPNRNSCEMNIINVEYI